MGFAHHEDSADLSSIDVKKLLTPVQWNLFYPNLHGCRKKNHPFMTK